MTAHTMPMTRSPVPQRVTLAVTAVVLVTAAALVVQQTFAWATGDDARTALLAGSALSALVATEVHRATARGVRLPLYVSVLAVLLIACLGAAVTAGTSPELGSPVSAMTADRGSAAAVLTMTLAAAAAATATVTSRHQPSATRLRSLLVPLGVGVASLALAATTMTITVAAAPDLPEPTPAPIVADALDMLLEGGRFDATVERTSNSSAPPPMRFEINPEARTVTIHTSDGQGLPVVRKESWQDADGDDSRLGGVAPAPEPVQRLREAAIAVPSWTRDGEVWHGTYDTRRFAAHWIASTPEWRDRLGLRWGRGWDPWTAKISLTLDADGAPARVIVTDDLYGIKTTTEIIYRHG